MAGSTTTIAVLGLLVLLLYDLCEFGDTVGTGATVPAVLSTTTEFDPEKRGDKKFGDPCDLTKECGFEHSICDLTRKCTCELEFPITNHFDKCGKSANVNESCFFTEQCEYVHQETECKDGHCKCRFERTPVPRVDGGFDCVARNEPHEPERYVDPAMIGVLVGMALMFVIICVVLRLFSNARWRENRTIFNTPNPRLMNVSLLRESKQERRGSRASVRGPSRQPSMASLRPHSPNSQGSRRGSHTSSTGSVKGSSNHHPTAINHPSSPTNQDGSGAVTVVQVQESNTKA